MSFSFVEPPMRYQSSKYTSDVSSKYTSKRNKTNENAEKLNCCYNYYNLYHYFDHNLNAYNTYLHKFGYIKSKSSPTLKYKEYTSSDHETTTTTKCFIETIL